MLTKSNLQNLSESSKRNKFKKQVMTSLTDSSAVPSKRQEEWRYTNTNFLKNYSYKSGVGGSLKISVTKNKINFVLNSSSITEVKVNKELPNGIRVLVAEEALTFLKKNAKKTSNHAWERTNYFSDLSYVDGEAPVVIVIDSEYENKNLIEIVQKSKGPVAHIQNRKCVVYLEKFSSATIVEKVSSVDKALLNINTDYMLSYSANAQVLKVESNSGHVITNTRILLQKDSLFDHTCINTIPEWSRSNINCELLGTGAELFMNGSYVGHKNSYIDHHTVIDHKAAHSYSHQNYHGILGGKSRYVFNGQINIHRDAQKVDSKLLNKNILLSKSAEVNTKPELNIDADDVKAAHGATVGRLQGPELFYLMSRGISSVEAQRMLCEGFVRGVVSQLVPELKPYFISELEDALKTVVE